MAFLTRAELGYQTIQKSFLINENIGTTITTNKVFLSYRRKDKDLVIPIVKFLLKAGAKIYIDFLDDSLPDIPSYQTASILRDRIRSSKKFILMATQNSKESTWIPWELGLSDGYIAYQNTIILPVTESENKWDEVEYYGVYGHIEKAYSTNKSIYDWAVIYPHSNEKNLWLSEWIIK